MKTEDLKMLLFKKIKSTIKSNPLKIYILLEKHYVENKDAYLEYFYYDPGVTGELVLIFKFLKPKKVGYHTYYGYLRTLKEEYLKYSPIQVKTLLFIENILREGKYVFEQE